MTNLLKDIYELEKLERLNEKYRQRNFFIEESNRIERICRPPNTNEIKEFDRFMALEEISVAQLKKFVSIYQPDAILRNKVGLNVRLGSYHAPPGGRAITSALQEILSAANGTPPGRSRKEMAFFIHQKYEKLHPFTDGNGRSGRMLWAWMMQDFPLGFLHHWYYDSLSAWRD